MTHGLITACQDALHELDHRGHPPQEVAVYVHPTTLHRGTENAAIQDYCRAMLVETSENLPQDLVVAVHLKAARHGGDAIAFARVDS